MIRDESAVTALLRAAHDGDATTVAAILDAHPDLINERGDLSGHDGRRTALHFGIHHEPVVRLLLERGADPNIRDDGDHAFPLHFAAEKGDMALVRLLVEHGAQTVAGEVDEHELDIIGWACAWEYVSDREELVRYLLEHGARHTIFSAVAMGDTVAIREIVAESPAALNRRMDDTNHHRRPLHLAVVKQQREALRVLLTLGAEVDAPDAAGLTPLDQAALYGERELADILLDHGATLGLPAAIGLGRAADVERVLREDPDALRPGGRWGELIVAAARRAPADVIDMLVRYGASPNATDTQTAVDTTSNYTALHAAAWEGNLAAVQALLRHGANPHVRDGKYGGTPADWADHNGKADCRDAIVAGTFVRMACLDWRVGGPERHQQTATAGRLLARLPEIARADLITAVVCGDLDDVRRRLSERPELARQRTGPRDWPPLLYLCSARLPGTAWSEHSVEIARALLDAGADPNAYYEGGNPDIHYTCITSLVGRGEEQATVHPRARELAALLLERGAEPYDIQFFYNAFAGHASQRFLKQDDFVWLLDLIYEHSVRRGRRTDWQDPEWKMIGMGGYGDGAGYLQRCAAQANVPRIAEWVVAHGGRDHREDIRLQAEATASREAQLFRAAERNDVEAVRQLLDGGLSPDVAHEKNGSTALHHAAYNNALDVVRLLIERGVAIDPIDGMHGTSPINWAFWGGSHEAVDLLAPRSRDVWALTRAGKIDRLREVLASEPRLAALRDEHDTILFYLPDDERVAAETVTLLLASGADPSVKRKDGATAADVAWARGLDEAARRLSGQA